MMSVGMGLSGSAFGGYTHPIDRSILLYNIFDGLLYNSYLSDPLTIGTMLIASSDICLLMLMDYSFFLFRATSMCYFLSYLEVTFN